MLERMRLCASLFMRPLLACVWLAGLSCAAVVSAETEDTDASDYDDCTRIELDFEAGAGVLTDEEKIALMEREFYESLARFDRCQASFSSDGGGGGGAGSAGDSDGNDGAGAGEVSDGDQSGEVRSLPSASVSGTEPEQPSQEGAERQPYALQPATADGAPTPQNNGKAPDDIPPADNDGIIAQALREAAQNEKDPEQREKLWNEYRKYKNLPVKKLPSEAQPAEEQSAEGQPE